MDLQFHDTQTDCQDGTDGNEVGLDPAAESFVPVVAAVLRAESITELPVVGRFLTNDPSNRPGTIIPDDVLEAARQSSDVTAP